MFPAAATPAAPVIAPLGRPPDQPSAYCPIPQRLITDLHDNPLAIGLYGLIARLYLVAQTPIPLSVPDVVRYDPTLSRGAVLRALARLRAGGYITEAEQPGRKTRYTPAWGRIGGAPLPWDMRQPCLGRPRHVARLRVDRRLLDICMGKLVPHLTRAAVITRYVTTPVLSLSDIGCYALTIAGVPRTTPALIRLGAVQDGTARSLPSDERLLALISQRALGLGEQEDSGAELTISGTRKLGVTPLLTPDPETVMSQPLFFRRGNSPVQVRLDLRPVVRRDCDHPTGRGMYATIALTVFLDVNNRFGLGEPGQQARMLAAQVGQLVGQRIAGWCFGATGLGRQGLELTGGAQRPPLDEMRRVQSFAPSIAHQSRPALYRHQPPAGCAAWPLH